MTDAAPPQPPDMGRLPMSERTSAMEKWLVDNRIAYEEGTAGIKKAWTRAQNRHRDAARREREREAHRASGVATPLPSSIARMARAPAQTSTCDPSSRRRDAAFGRELIGLLVDVPWSAWDGYPVDSGFETGIVWEYHAQPPGRFVISFDPGGDHDDKNDDIGMGWGELMGEQHCLSSEGERAALRWLPADSLKPVPRGAVPHDAAWDQREGAWVDRRGVRLFDEPTDGMLMLLLLCAFAVSAHDASQERCSAGRLELSAG